MVVPDAQLLQAWRGGDRDAGRELLSRHYESLSRFFRHKVGDESPDLIQQTMLACVESHARIRGDASFRTYLFTVARNELYRYLKRCNGNAAPPDFSTQSVIDLGATPSSVVSHREEQRLLLAGLHRISVDAQILLELYYWEELSTTAIAEVLDVPPSTLRSRLQAARRAVATQMEAVARSPEVLQSTLNGFDAWIGSVRGKIVAAERPNES